MEWIIYENQDESGEMEEMAVEPQENPEEAAREKKRLAWVQQIPTPRHVEEDDEDYEEDDEEDSDIARILKS